MGVFSISHNRDERIARRVTRTIDATGVDPYSPPDGLPRGPAGANGNGSGRRESHESIDAERRAHGMCSFVADHPGGGERPSGLMNGGVGGTGPLRLSAVDLAALHQHQRQSDFARTTAMSEACSVCSVASAATQASLEESVFFALGGGTFSSFTSGRRMARNEASMTGDLLPVHASPQRSLADASTPTLSGRPRSRTNGRTNRPNPDSLPDMSFPGGDARGSCSVREALLPRCSEATSSESVSVAHVSREQTRNSEDGDNEGGDEHTPYEERQG